MPRVSTVGLILSAVLLAACQRYDWIFQPESNRTVVHLPFSVQTPSKADILFVIDNSGTMADKQQALADSVGTLLDGLAKNDTSYRIGIVSTDDLGWDVDCSNVPYSLPPEWLPTGHLCNTPGIAMRRPHDGVLGRLLAAYDPAAFDPGLYAELDTQQKVDVFASLVPTGVDTGPAGTLTGTEGVPWVIDRDVVRAEACRGCSCDCAAADAKQSACYTGCVDPVATALVKAYFDSNVRGLGTEGKGWEQGMRSAMLAVGIDPELSVDHAIDPLDSTLTRFNAYTTLDESGNPVTTKWLRDQAILGIMFVSDEEDCSMPPSSFSSIRSLEATEPEGSGCYQLDGQAMLTPVDHIVQLLTARKATQSKVALGFIGAVKPTGPTTPVDNHTISAVPSDCRLDTAASPAVPSYECSCLASEPSDTRWCAYTQTTGTSAFMCEALAGHGRYVQVADEFARHTYDSICQTNYGAALSRFALSLISACFDIDARVEPVQGDPANIQVIRTPSAELGEAAVPTEVPYLASCSDPGPGWCYFPAVAAPAGGVAQGPQVCLVGFDRLIGDHYDISILTTDHVDRTK